MREEESSCRGRAALRVLGRQRHRERDTTQRGESRVVGQQRRQCRVPLVHRVSERLEDPEAGAVAPGVRDGEAAGGDDQGIGGDRRRVGEIHAPAFRGCREVRDERLHANRGPALAGVREQGVTDIARLVRDGKTLRRLGLDRERDLQLVLEERDLLIERPGAEHLAHRVHRRVGHVARLVQTRGEHVAPSTATDEDLAAAVLRALEERHLGAGLRGEDRGHAAGRTGADDDHAPSGLHFYFTAESNIHPMIHQRVPSWNSVMLFTPRVNGSPPGVRAEA